MAAELGRHEHSVGKRRRRFLKDRCDGLFDEARPGRPRTINDEQVAAVIERTLRTTPADATHWSVRSMATETGATETGATETGFSHTIDPPNVGGVRKAGATIATENGATEYELMAIFGWGSAKEAARYARQANRKRLAAKALRLVAPPEPI